jgi:hypothetical protein
MEPTKKDIVLSTCIPLGNLLRSDKVTFNVNGQELKQINGLIDALEVVLNQINSDEIVVTAAELPALSAPEEADDVLDG